MRSTISYLVGEDDKMSRLSNFWLAKQLMEDLMLSED